VVPVRHNPLARHGRRSTISQILDRCISSGRAHGKRSETGVKTLQKMHSSPHMYSHKCQFACPPKSPNSHRRILRTETSLQLVTNTESELRFFSFVPCTIPVRGAGIPWDHPSTTPVTPPCSNESSASGPGDCIVQPNAQDGRQSHDDAPASGAPALVAIVTVRA